MAPAMGTDSRRVVDTYTRAADSFDALAFWHHFGRRTVEAAELAPGGRVLDLCCGTGASALPAAEVVGPQGSVLGIDLTPALVAIARTNASARGLHHARFEVGDVAELQFAPGRFDAVVSVFGIFFLEDVPTVLRRAWSWLGPAGVLATTVWGEIVLSPGERFFWDAVSAEDSSIGHISPAATLATPEALARVHEEAGIPAPKIVREHWRLPLPSPEAFWPVILGTSNRGVFEALTPEAQARVKRRVTERLSDERVDALDMEALMATVRKTG